LRGCFSNGVRHQHDGQFEFAAYGSGLLPFAACTVLGCCWHRLFNKLLHQPNPRRSLPLTWLYRQHVSANLNLCLPPLKKKRSQASVAYSGCNGYWITCCTTQADNFSAIARNFIPILIFHLAPPSKFQLFGLSK